MAARKVTIRTGCKINLGLRIIGVRTDGYHELDSLFYPLQKPYDQLDISFSTRDGIRVCCDASDIDPTNNTLTRAYSTFLHATGHAPGIDVSLHKGIPSGAGLGGGSSDAAALLLWLNNITDKPLDMTGLANAALSVGADTPFFLQKSPCRVQGIGERLSPAADIFAGFRLVLLCPDLHISTAWAYAAYDAMTASTDHHDGQISLTNQPHKVSKTSCSDTFAPTWNLHNDLEAVVFAQYPMLDRLKTEILRLGACGACMSGSGSSIIGLFSPAAANIAQKAALLLKKNKCNVFTVSL